MMVMNQDDKNDDPSTRKSNSSTSSAYKECPRVTVIEDEWGGESA
jgi:hypothetical protein